MRNVESPSTTTLVKPALNRSELLVFFMEIDRAGQSLPTLSNDDYGHDNDNDQNYNNDDDDEDDDGDGDDDEDP